MGAAGSDVAIQAADVALLSENMDRLAEAHHLARRTSVIIRQNLAFALTAMAVLVVGGLFFDLPLPLAVIGHEGGTLLVVLSGLRLLAIPAEKSRKGEVQPEQRAQQDHLLSNTPHQAYHRKVPRHSA